jgi:nitric oxide reductase subunit B
VALNLGLAWMVFATPFPLGILQLYHSISVSYYDARTLNYIGSGANSILEWLRMPGDIVFIVGGAMPVLYLTYLGIRYMRSGTTTEEPKEILFTKIIVPGAGTSGSASESEFVKVQGPQER